MTTRWNNYKRFKDQDDPSKYTEFEVQQRKEDLYNIINPSMKNYSKVESTYGLDDYANLDLRQMTLEQVEETVRGAINKKNDFYQSLRTKHGLDSNFAE